MLLWYMLETWICRENAWRMSGLALIKEVKECQIIKEKGRHSIFRFHMCFKLAIVCTQPLTRKHNLYEYLLWMHCLSRQIVLHNNVFSMQLMLSVETILLTTCSQFGMHYEDKVEFPCRPLAH